MSKDRRLLYSFQCEDCGLTWKKRAVPGKNYPCPDCSSDFVFKEKVSGLEYGRQPHWLMHYRTELIQAYENDPNHRAELEADA
jgi:DNA-directed RNA polymerase subunit RPC12/RpoP